MERIGYLLDMIFRHPGVQWQSQPSVMEFLGYSQRLLGLKVFAQVTGY